MKHQLAEREKRTEHEAAISRPVGMFGIFLLSRQMNANKI